MRHDTGRFYCFCVLNIYVLYFLYFSLCVMYRRSFQQHNTFICFLRCSHIISAVSSKK